MMSKQKQGSLLETKSKQNFTCCSCFGRRSSSTSTIAGLAEPNEPYEYVVEKLAIKRVPLRLFATPEDLEKHNRTIRSNSTPTVSVVSQKSAKEASTVTPLEEKASSVTFSSYYKIIPQPPIDEHVAKAPLLQHGDSITSLPCKIEEDVVCNATFQQQSLPIRVMTEDQEKQLVSQILNKHSSLFTLDMKNPVPKDPDRLPKNKVIVPPCVQTALRNNRQEQFPPVHGRQQVPVDVHRASVSTEANNSVFMPPIKSPTIIPFFKKELTPELKQTINALGLAQKLHIPGFPHKNQRSVQGGTVSDGSTEKEMYCGVLTGNEVVEEIPSYELSCQHLELKNRDAGERIQCRKKGGSIVIQSSCGESDDDTYGSSSSKSQYSEGIRPRFPRNVTVQRYTATQNNKSILVVPNKSSDQIQSSKKHESVGTSDPQLQDSEQITEISQLKGQSLKWKIIIKHHSDNNDKEDSAIISKSEETDTDSESKAYFLRNRSRSSSPHQ